MKPLYKPIRPDKRNASGGAPYGYIYIVRGGTRTILNVSSLTLRELLDRVNFPRLWVGQLFRADAVRRAVFRHPKNEPNSDRTLKKEIGRRDRWSATPNCSPQNAATIFNRDREGKQNFLALSGGQTAAAVSVA